MTEGNTNHTTSPRFHVEGQTSTQGARWQIWDNAPDKHFARFRNIADHGDAVAICHELNGLARQPQSPSTSLSDAIQMVLVGGNHLALLIGADHPAYTEHPRDALEHYGSSDTYEIWCCWRSIMRLREAMKSKEQSK